ncbi:YqhG family protein [Paenibacillus dendritiformis]|uniref:YqhG family protein n=1 Tax=Paenibacillus dendritiformis TaxID=130049 RepID=UPI0020C1D42F|nr:YqhG family protein [Paenibacillus dendritiformis]CAH8771923.1 YqhG family protein [Paenibacillus dendritiformis]
MNTEQVRDYVLRYLEATDCHILEKSPAHVTVKLSERADRVLTNRPYYWGFIDRTGAEAETMRFTFVFDPAAMPPEPPRAVSYGSAPGESVLGRYFGVAPAFTGGGGGPGRIPRDDVTYGSKRLEQIMQAAHTEGRFIQLFVEPPAAGGVRGARRVKQSAPHEPWLLLNFKLEFACDLKREEIHSYGISLVSGKMRLGYMEEVLRMDVTPKLPPHVHVLPWRLSLPAALSYVEEHLAEVISSHDDAWAREARVRLEEELSRLASYYEPLIREAASQQPSRMRQEEAPAPPPNGEDREEEARPMTIEEQYEVRQQEVRWQFEPRIEVSLISAGLVHVPMSP